MGPGLPFLSSRSQLFSGADIIRGRMRKWRICYRPSLRQKVYPLATGLFAVSGSPTSRFKFIETDQEHEQTEHRSVHSKVVCVLGVSLCLGAGA